MSAPPSTPPPAGIPVVWTTPRTLVGFRTAIWALVLMLFLTGESTLSTSRATFKTIGKDAAPSIIAADEIGYALADLDANVANSLLGAAQHRQAAVAVIEKQRVKVTDGLIDAAENITYGDAEKVPIRLLTRGFGVYLERAAEARLRFEQGDVDGARTSYWEATELLHATLLPQAAQLDRANREALDRSFAQERRVNDGAEGGALALGLLVLLSLLSLQVFLFRKTHRILNPALLAGTFVAFLFTAYLVTRFSAAREDLRLAKEDAFDSIHALVRARAIAYDANGDESRFLLESQHTHGFEAAFRSKVLLLTSSPALASDASRELSAFVKLSGGHHRKPKYTGLLWDEVGNITFDGEYAGAARAMKAFADYYGIDGRIRSLAASGKLTDAIELCIGGRPDESNAAFDRFDSGLGSALDINRAAFDAAIDRGRSDLGAAEYWGPAFALVIAFLTWLGLQPRLREYRA